ncbi:HesA/MoeB/ThiF family protein [Candidatus Palauibacter irciniicola]|uniref:HesA/MoeB/ThiF family protein n=1 Tax=Candidatus Palauibacter irciniicola TaxID=3056733 RepID=UPI003B0131B2
MDYSVVMTSGVAAVLRRHLLQHIRRGEQQEDLCFALWKPSTGETRTTAVLNEVVLPVANERRLHGGASFLPNYLDRVAEAAMSKNAGIALLHSHFTPGWQGMSDDDVDTERSTAPSIFGETGLPLIGLTMGTDGALSARFWTRVGRREYERRWCGSVRVVGDDFDVTFMEELAPAPKYKEMLKRTYSAWGEEKQHTLARLHCGVIGVGSVGAIVAEGLARMGVETISLMDFDTVEEHNLDRLLHATVDDIGRFKVDVAGEQLLKHATADDVDVRLYRKSVTRADGLRAALDCDVLFSCVDRPWPRQVLNMAAFAHYIPVVDGGVHVRVKPDGSMRGAEWGAHVAMPGRACLECLGQFDPANVTLERQGLLDDPTYIEQLREDHELRRNENVFGFALSVSGMMVCQFLSLVVQPAGMGDAGVQTYHFTTGMMDSDVGAACTAECLYCEHLGTGDRFPFPVVEADEANVAPSAVRVPWWAKWRRRVRNWLRLGEAAGSDAGESCG